MRSSRAARWAPLSGIVFAVLSLAGLLGLLATPDSDDDAAISSFFGYPANRRLVMTGFFLVLAASLVFLWFLTVLRGRSARAEGRTGSLTALSFGAGLVAAALWVVAGALYAAIAFTEHVSHEFTVDPDAYRLASGMGYVTWVSATAFALLVVFATSVVSLKARLLPAWLAWLGLLAALTMPIFLAVIPFLLDAPVIPFFVPVEFEDPEFLDAFLTLLPFVVFLVWVLLVSVVFLVHSEETETRT